MDSTAGEPRGTQGAGPSSSRQETLVLVFVLFGALGVVLGALDRLLAGRTVSGSLELAGGVLMIFGVTVFWRRRRRERRGRPH